MGQDAEQRKTFRYWNGVDFVFGDPLRIQRDLYIKLGDPDTAFDDAEKTKKDANGQEQLTAEALLAQNCINDNAREAFGMAPFDPKTGLGATDDDVEEALAALWEYMEKKSKSTGMRPSSDPSTTSIPTLCPTQP